MHVLLPLEATSNFGTTMIEEHTKEFLRIVRQFRGCLTIGQLSNLLSLEVKVRLIIGYAGSLMGDIMNGLLWGRRGRRLTGIALSKIA